MTAVTARTVLQLWEPGSRLPPHRRLAALLDAAGIADSCAETLGARNRRLARMHAELVGRSIEAQVQCAKCGTDNEFVVPRDAIAAIVPPSPDAVINVDTAGHRRHFRLPVMADLEAIDPAAPVGPQLARRCSLDDEGAAAPAYPEGLEAAFEALDPAADVTVSIDCAGCGIRIEASVDMAAFVARDLDRLAQGLYREIDAIAGAYGWREDEILALPPSRRRRYMAIISSRQADHGAAT